MSWYDANVLGAVGDDGMLSLYDLRQNTASSNTSLHSKEVNVLKFSPFDANLFLSASSDNTAALWDFRNLRFPLHVLEGHSGAVFSGAWSPVMRNVVATAGMDRRVIVWDLNRIGLEQTAEEAEDGPAELLFVHGGHVSRVNDISWNRNVVMRGGNDV